MGRVDIGRVVTVWVKRFAGADKIDLLLGRMRMVREDHLAANRLPDHARHGNPDLREQLVRRYFAAKRAAQPGGMDNESFWALRQNAVLGTLNGIEVIKRLFIDQDDDAGEIARIGLYKLVCVLVAAQPRVELAQNIIEDRKEKEGQ